MPIYNHPSWIYFNDTEFFELLSNLGHRELLKVARARGLIFSEKCDDAAVRSSLSLLPSNWPLITHIYSLIAKPDPTERKSSLHVRGCSEQNDAVIMAQAVREARAQKNEELYTINQESPEITRIVVGYTETDLTKALQYSRRKRSAEIEVVKKGGEITFVHDATEKARMIVRELKKLIKPADGETIKEEAISLRTVRDPALRTRFFTELLKGITGQSFVGASHVLVDCRLPNDDSENENEDDEPAKTGASRQAKKMKSIINKMSFSGELVLGAPLYQQATETGYFITQINWTTEDKQDAGKFLDYVAGFGDSINCDHFSSDVAKRWQWSVDNPDKAETVPLPLSDRRALNELVQKSADKAFATIMKESQEPKTATT